MATDLNLPYQRDAEVFLVTESELETSWQQLLVSSQFMDVVTQTWKRSGKEKGAFSVVIKADFMTATGPENPATYTDPRLVNGLVAELKRAGFLSVWVGEAENEYSYAYQERTVIAVGQACGYVSDAYKLVDLQRDSVMHSFEGVLGDYPISRLWKEADFRISFAKNRTDWRCFYAGCLLNVLGCLPASDRLRQLYGRGHEFYECCGLVLAHFPVHFGFIDAWYSQCSLGATQHGVQAIQTTSLLASANVVALDWVQGEKMNVNPSLNFMLQEALFRWGPVHIIRRGNMTAWSAWRNVRGLLVLLWDMIDDYPALCRFWMRATVSETAFKPAKGQWFFRLLRPLLIPFTVLLTQKIRSV